MKITFLLILSFIGFSILEDEKTGYDIGDIAADFKLINIDDAFVSMENYKEAKGFVIVFTCNHCPFSVRYEDRIIDLDEKYKPLGYPVIAISPNDIEAFPEDDLANMKVRAKEKGFTFPYLYDETQEIAKAYGAKKTPHIFLLNKESSEDMEQLVVKYIGAIDDDTSEAKVEQKYLANAIDALLNNTEIDPNVTKAVGCSVKWKK